jgi:hypothetical protein
MFKIPVGSVVQYKYYNNPEYGIVIGHAEQTESFNLVRWFGTQKTDFYSTASLEIISRGEE